MTAIEWLAASHELLAASRDQAGLAAPQLRDELFELQNGLQDELFGGPPTPLEPRVDIAPDEPRLQIILDALEALSIGEPSDPSYPWMRGGVLSTVGRHLEAADDYLVAAERFRRMSESGEELTGDESDWAGSALFHAARNLALGQQPVSAAALLGALPPEDRNEIEPLIHRSLDRIAAG